MGIDAHGLALLNHSVQVNGALGATVTLGRQAIHLPSSVRKHFLNGEISFGDHAERLLIEVFGASEVSSIDNSSYEGASILADLNQPLPNDLHLRFDTVLDFGCIEHVYDVSQSLRNTISICRLGGRILHVLPSNGFCGHGFYQFSPELFFSLYCEQNGFADTEVFLADPVDSSHWFRVPTPSGGRRINIRSNHEVYVLVATRKLANTKLSVQQSDYKHAWETGAAKPQHGRNSPFRDWVNELIAHHPMFARTARRLSHVFRPREPYTLDGHPDLVRVRLSQRPGA